MFTDQPVTPLHLVNLLEFVREYSFRTLTRDIIKDAFQPPSLTQKQTQSIETIKAAIELGLIEESPDKKILATKALSGKKPIDECLKIALDEKVLGSLDIENYLALFYSYMLGLNHNFINKNNEDWAFCFNRDVFGNKEQPNQFNTTKLSGLHRWYSYMGLGWYDQTVIFNCNPFHRISRRLPWIFKEKKKLESNQFMSALSYACPELDGGEIFLQANSRYDLSAKQISLGLSHALIDLHYNGQITLHCPKDSDGWSIAIAAPPSDKKTLIGDRISQVEIGKGNLA